MASLQKLQERLKRFKERELDAGHQDTPDKSNHGTDTLGQNHHPTLPSPESDSTASTISSHSEWLVRIAERGHQPEDWLEFLVFLRDKAPFTNDQDRYPFIVNMYARAIKNICSKAPKRNEAFAQLLVDAALFRQQEDVDEVRTMFKSNRMMAGSYAFYHIAFAQFELDLGNHSKSRKILEMAKEANAEPKELLYVAFKNLLATTSPLISKSDLERCNTGTYMNYTGELSASLSSKLSNFTQDNINSRPMTNPDIGNTSLLQSKSSNSSVTAPQLSLHSSKKAGSGFLMPTTFSHSKPRLPASNARKDPGYQAIGHTTARNDAHTCTHDEPVSESGDHRTLQKSHSTPDCKGPGILSSVSCSNYWRVARTRKAPSIRQLRNAMVEEENEDATNTMDMLNIRPLPPSPVSTPASYLIQAEKENNVSCEDTGSAGLSYKMPSTVKKLRGDEDKNVQYGRVPVLHGQASRKELHFDHTPLTTQALSHPTTTQASSHTTAKNQVASTASLAAHPAVQVTGSSAAAVPNLATVAPSLVAVVQSSEDVVPRSAAVLYNLAAVVPSSAAVVTNLASVAPNSANVAPSSAAVSPFSTAVALSSASVAPSLSTVAPSLAAGPRSSVTMAASQPVSSRTMEPEKSSTLTQPGSTIKAKPSSQTGSLAVKLSHPSATRELHHDGNTSQMQRSYPALPTHPLYQFTPRKLDEVLVVNSVPYCILKPIGRGGSSKVYRVFDPDKNLKAIKCVDLKTADELTIESYLNEIDLLQRLQSNNRVIRLYDYELNEEKGILYLVLEAGEVDLANLLRNLKKTKTSLSMFKIKSYWSDMLEAVQGLHSEGIVHSDLKPANFLLVSGLLKLIDFGIAKMVPQDKTSVFQAQAMGTLNYMSPEAIMMDMCDGPAVDENGKPQQKYKVGVKSDVWSLGCILFFMVHGRTPFQNITNEALKLNAIANPNYQIAFPDSADFHVTDVLKKCLVRDPKQRASIEELLHHPFLRPEQSSCQEEVSLTPHKQLVLQKMQTNINDCSPGAVKLLMAVLKKGTSKGQPHNDKPPALNLEGNYIS